jgi:hypothetical protein
LLELFSNLYPADGHGITYKAFVPHACWSFPVNACYISDIGCLLSTLALHCPKWQSTVYVGSSLSTLAVHCPRWQSTIHIGSTLYLQITLHIGSTCRPWQFTVHVGSSLSAVVVWELPLQSLVSKLLRCCHWAAAALAVAVVLVRRGRGASAPFFFLETALALASGDRHLGTARGEGIRHLSTRRIHRAAARRRVRGRGEHSNTGAGSQRSYIQLHSSCNTLTHSTQQASQSQSLSSWRRSTANGAVARLFTIGMPTGLSS